MLVMYPFTLDECILLWKAMSIDVCM